MSKAHNYLRSNRKQLELSQGEVAFLLGGHDRAKISKHEMLSVEPSLMTALAYEAIYRKPIRELFAGFYQQVEKDVAVRASVLTHRRDRGRSSRRSAIRSRTFNELATLESLKPLIDNENDNF